MMKIQRTGLAVALATASLIATGCSGADTDDLGAHAAGSGGMATVDSSAAPVRPPGTSQVASASGATTGAPSIKVYKTPTCGCCTKWVEHLQANGFKVETMDMPDLALIKQKHGITDKLESCHTGVVNGYVIEGHVPADVIHKLLREKPQVAGLAVPGMPIGSPGMEGATKERYDVLTFNRAGRTTVYARK